MGRYHNPDSRSEEALLEHRVSQPADILAVSGPPLCVLLSSFTVRCAIGRKRRSAWTSMIHDAFKTIIFDFDYTLADSSRGIIQCTNYALLSMGLPSVSDEAVCRTIGMSLKD